jgi:hypothetical protein
MAVGKKTGGRPPGSLNKATREAKTAIAAFVDGNAHRLEEWLDAVARGDPDHDVKPNPAKAFELFQSVIEYHLPKMARTELAGDPDAPIEVNLDVTEVAKNIAFVFAKARASK